MSVNIKNKKTINFERYLYNKLKPIQLSKRFKTLN